MLIAKGIHRVSEKFYSGLAGHENTQQKPQSILGKDWNPAPKIVRGFERTAS